jgi:dihydrodipicolinate synthase/N-acetylneuraminate lyase
MANSDSSFDLRSTLKSGMVIPAHPLALDASRRLDEVSQRALTRYYCAAGAGGVAVGVHTTQFAIREPGIDLFRPVLELATETVREYERAHAGARRIVRIAGVCGPTPRAVSEAEIARDLGYDAALLSLAALAEADHDALIDHCRTVAGVMPVFGFYLQPAVGGRTLDVGFWRRFFEIENVVAVKTAPFNRYQTLDVLRAAAEVGRNHDIAFYTGNDDHIILDLLTPVVMPGPDGKKVKIHFSGGLLGQWAVWTRKAVGMLDDIRRVVRGNLPLTPHWLTLNADLTDANSAIFDAAHDFAGCIPGIMEILRRQGLVQSRACLDPGENLSPGQSEEIDRVCALYPHLADDAFVAEHLDEWRR